MNCDEIRKLLPAYLEDTLTPEEKKSVESHLTSCALCSRSREDLKKVDNLLKGLGDVEPPPFFQQRVMARVREEARQKKGILRKFFYPLGLKIPIQVSAMLLVAVLAFYLYQKNEPEMQRLKPFPLPLNETGNGQKSAEPPQGLPAQLARREPAKDLEPNRQRFAASPFENKGQADGTADRPALIPEGRPSTIIPGTPVKESREKDVPPPRSEALEKTQDRDGKVEVGRLSVGPAKKQLTLDLMIQVRDTTIAIREIEGLLIQVNARTTERQHHEGREFLRAEIASQKVALFLDRLEKVGKVDLDRNTLDFPEGRVTVSITMVPNP